MCISTCSLPFHLYINFLVVVSVFKHEFRLYPVLALAVRLIAIEAFKIAGLMDGLYVGVCKVHVHNNAEYILG